MFGWDPSDKLLATFVLGIAVLLVVAAACFGLGTLVVVRGGLPALLGRPAPEASTALAAGPVDAASVPAPTSTLAPGTAGATAGTPSGATAEAASGATAGPSALPGETPLPGQTAPIPPTTLPTQAPGGPLPSPTATQGEAAGGSPTLPPTEPPPPGATDIPPTAVPPPTDVPPTSPPAPTSVVTPEPVLFGDVLIIEMDKVQEYLILYNISGHVVDLTNWRIVSENGSETCYVPSITVAPDREVTIWTMAKDVGPGEVSCGLDTGMWADNELDVAAVYDGDGKLVDRYPPD